MGGYVKLRAGLHAKKKTKEQNKSTTVSNIKGRDFSSFQTRGEIISTTEFLEAKIHQPLYFHPLLIFLDKLTGI